MLVEAIPGRLSKRHVNKTFDTKRRANSIAPCKKNHVTRTNGQFIQRFAATASWVMQRVPRRVRKARRHRDGTVSLFFVHNGRQGDLN